MSTCSRAACGKPRIDYDEWHAGDGLCHDCRVLMITDPDAFYSARAHDEQQENEIRKLLSREHAGLEPPPFLQLCILVRVTDELRRNAVRTLWEQFVSLLAANGFDERLENGDEHEGEA